MINYSHDIHELLYFHSSGLLLQPDKCRGSFRRQREAKAGRSWTLHVHTKVDKTEHHMAQKRNPLLQNQKDIYVSPGESTRPFLFQSTSLGKICSVDFVGRIRQNCTTPLFNRNFGIFLGRHVIIWDGSQVKPIPNPDYPDL